MTTSAGDWRSWLARMHDTHEVPSSSLGSPTSFLQLHAEPRTLRPAAFAWSEAVNPAGQCLGPIGVRIQPVELAATDWQILR
jgi:hypothetical protein